MKAKLKVVPKIEKVSRELLIVGRIHSKNYHKDRHYKEVDNAIPKLTQWMLRDGKVGDVCEIYHNITGLQIGTIKMSATGKLITNYIWEK